MHNMKGDVIVWNIKLLKSRKLLQHTRHRLGYSRRRWTPVEFRVGYKYFKPTHSYQNFMETWKFESHKHHFIQTNK